MSYTKTHLDFELLPPSTNPGKALNANAVDLEILNLKPNEGHTFMYYRRIQEEIYTVIKGSGVILIRDVIYNKLIDIITGDIVRVSPNYRRALKANENGMIVMCTRASTIHCQELQSRYRYRLDDSIPDYNDIPLWYKDNEDVKLRNKMLQEQVNDSKIEHIKYGDWIFTCSMYPQQFKYWTCTDFDSFETLTGSSHDRYHCGLKLISEQYALWFNKNKLWELFDESIEDNDIRWETYENSIKLLCDCDNIEYEGY